MISSPSPITKRLATHRPLWRPMVLCLVLAVLACAGCGGTEDAADSTIRPEAPLIPDVPAPAPAEPAVLIGNGSKFAVESALQLPLNLDVAADILSAIADGPALYVFDKLFEGNGVVGDLVLALLQGVRDDIRDKLQQQLQDDLDLADIEDKLRHIADRLRALGQATLLSELHFGSALREDQPAEATHVFAALVIDDQGSELRLTPKLAQEQATWSATTTVTLLDADQLELGPHTLVLPLTEMVMAKVALDVLSEAREQSLTELLGRVLDCTVISEKISTWIGNNISGLQAIIDILSPSLLLGCHFAITAIPRLIHDEISHRLTDGVYTRNVGLSGTASLSIDADGSVSAMVDGLWNKKLGTFSAARIDEVK